MIITLGLVFIFIVGGVILSFARENSGWESVGAMMTISGLFLVLFCILRIIIAPLHIKTDIADYTALKTSLEIARANTAVSPVELATIQRDVIGFNRRLARRTVWAKHPLTNWFYSKRFFEMKPIR